MPKVVKTGMKQSRFLKDFREGVAYYAWVKRVTIRVAEYEAPLLSTRPRMRAQA